MNNTESTENHTELHKEKCSIPDVCAIKPHHGDILVEYLHTTNPPSAAELPLKIKPPFGRNVQIGNTELPGEKDVAPFMSEISPKTSDIAHYSSGMSPNDSDIPDE